MIRIITKSRYTKLESDSKRLVICKKSLQELKTTINEVKIQLKSCEEEKLLLERNLKATNVIDEFKKLLNTSRSYSTIYTKDVLQLLDEEILDDLNRVLVHKRELKNKEEEINKINSTFVNFENLNDLEFDELSKKMLNTKFSNLFTNVRNILNLSAENIKKEKNHYLSLLWDNGKSLKNKVNA